MRLLAILCLLLPASLFAQSPEGMTCPQRTVVLVKPGPNASKAQTMFKSHLAFLLKLMRSGQLVVGGPSMDGGGMFVFSSKQWPEVEALLKDEPFLNAGVLAMDRHMLWNACEAAK